jgi:hypothetical protein
MITGRSGDDGSTELRSGDLIREGEKGGRRGRGGGSRGGRVCGNAEGSADVIVAGMEVEVEVVGTGGGTGTATTTGAGDVLLLKASVADEADECIRPVVLDGVGEREAEVGEGGGNEEEGDGGVCIPLITPRSRVGDFGSGGACSCCCCVTSDVILSRGHMRVRARLGVGVGDGGRLYPDNFFALSSRGWSASLVRSDSCIISSGAAADELVDGCSCISSILGTSSGAFSLLPSSAADRDDISGDVSFCCRASRDGVGVRARNVTLRLSGLSVNMGPYCDSGL